MKQVIILSTFLMFLISATQSYAQTYTAYARLEINYRLSKDAFRARVFLGSDTLFNLYTLPNVDSIATILFPKYLDALNYLSTLGWNLTSHSRGEMTEDIIIKKEYNLEDYLKWKSMQ